MSRPLKWLPRWAVLAAAWPRNRECTWRLAGLPNAASPVKSTTSRGAASSSGDRRRTQRPGRRGVTRRRRVGRACAGGPSRTRRCGEERRACPGYLSDLYSAFCPLSVMSPALEELH